MTHDTAPITGGDGDGRQPGGMNQDGLHEAFKTLQVIQQRAWALGDEQYGKLAQEAMDYLSLPVHTGEAVAWRWQQWSSVVGDWTERLTFDRPEAAVRTRNIQSLYAAPPPAAPEGEPTCQICGGTIQGWTCQSCGLAFKENDAGALVLSAPKATGGEGKGSFSQAKIPSQTEAGGSDNIQPGGGG